MKLNWRDSLVRPTSSSALWLNTFWLVGGNGSRLFVSGIYFVLLARLLGPSNFGLFSAILALSNLASPLAFMGQTDLLIQHLSRHPQDLVRMWGRGLLITTVGGLSLTIVLTGPLTLWLPGSQISWVGILLVAELFCVSWQYVEKSILIAFERLVVMALIDTGMACSRLILVCLAWGLGWSSLSTWVYLYGSTAVIVTIGVHCIIVQQLKAWPFQYSSPWQDLQGCLQQARLGWDFALGLLATKTFTDLDKLLLPRLASPESAGIYGAAYRLINMAQMPVIAFLTSDFAEVCRRGQEGFHSAYLYSLNRIPWVVGYGLGALVVLNMLSFAIPIVLGSDYQETSVALRWLSSIVVFEGIHLLASNFLTGVGLQRIRGYTQLLALGLNITLNMIWIPRWEWQGAARATLVAEVALVLLLAGILAMQLGSNQDSKS